MKIPDAIKSSLRDIRQRKVRAALTMLGIIIGIASVIVIMSLGASAEGYIVGQVQSFGSNLIAINPGAPISGAPASVAGVIIKTLVKRDVDALQNEPSIESVMANVTGQGQLVFQNKHKSVLWIATTPNVFQIMNLKFSGGHQFTDADSQAYNKVVVLGSKIAKDLFGDIDPVNKTVRLKDFSFRVIGVLEPKGAGIFSMDSYVMMPLNVGQKQLLGVDHYQEIDVKFDPAYNAEFVKERVISILRQNHRITDPSKDDFTVQSMDEAMNMLGNITSVLTIFLSAIAAISLVVGGIGIMNIMLVTVTERTREIGLRKAVGATERDILTQFLVESAILTTTGGVIGILGGALFTLIAYFGVNLAGIVWPFQLPLSAVLIAVSVSALTGIVFGVYPALQAARKNPIDALRYE